LTIYRDFMQKFLYLILRGGAILTENNWSLNVFGLRSNVISFVCAKNFWLRWLKWLCLARKV